MNCDYLCIKRIDRNLKVCCDELQTINYKRNNCYHTRFTIFLSYVWHRYTLVLPSFFTFFVFPFSACFHNPIPKSTCDKTLSSIPIFHFISTILTYFLLETIHYPTTMIRKEDLKQGWSPENMLETFFTPEEEEGWWVFLVE